MKEKTSEPTLFTEKLAQAAAGIYARNRASFLTALIFGFLAYGYAFTNKLPNPDDVASLFSKGATTDSGRWGLDLLQGIFPNFSMPWIYGILTIFLVSASICVILNIFQIKTPLIRFLLAGSVMVFPSLIGLFGYMFTSSSYGVALLLAVGSVWLIQQAWNRRHWCLALAAMGCLVFSMGIYQAYVAFAASLLVILLLKELALEGKPLLPTVGRGICLAGFLVVSMGAYYGIMQLAQALTHTGFNAYAATANSFQLRELPQRILLAYRSFLRFFTEGYLGLLPSPLAVLLHGALLAGSLGMTLAAVLRRKASPGQTLLTLAGSAVLLGLLPLAINCIYLFVSWWTVHMLVVYSFASLYVLAAVLADHFWNASACRGLPELLRRGALNAMALCLAGIVIANTYLANETYLSLHLRYENTYSFYNTLLADLNQNPAFTPGRKVAVLGNYQLPQQYSQKFTPSMQSSYMVALVPSTALSPVFLEYYLGVDLEFATAEEMAQILQSEQYQAMASYPYCGSIALIGEILTVKLS